MPHCGRLRLYSSVDGRGLVGTGAASSPLILFLGVDFQTGPYDALEVPTRP